MIDRSWIVTVAVELSPKHSSSTAVVIACSCVAGMLSSAITEITVGVRFQPFVSYHSAVTGNNNMIEVVLDDRLGKKVRIKCNEDDTIGDLKKLAAAQLGTRPEKLKIQKWYTIYKDHITLEDYEIHDGMGLELYYQ